MNCIKCNKEINDDFAVCPYCGTKVLKDGVICKSCQEVVVPNGDMCPKCKKRIDGKKVCYNCGNLLESEYSFCPKCSAPISNTKSRNFEGKNKANLYEIIKKGIFMIISIIIFVLSLSNIYIAKDKVLDYSSTVTFNYKFSVIDAYENLFLDEDYSPYELRKEYSNIFAKLELIENDNTLQDYEKDVKMEKLITKINLFKAVRASSNDRSSTEYDSKSDEALRGTFNELALKTVIFGTLNIIVSISLLAFSIYAFVKSFKGKNCKKLYSIGYLLVPFAFIYNMINLNTLVIKFGVNTTCLIMCVLAFCISCYDVLENTIISITNKKANSCTIHRISKVVANIVLVFLFGLGVINVKYSATASSDRSFNISYNANNFASSYGIFKYDAFRDTMNSTEYYTKVKDGINSYYNDNNSKSKNTIEYGFIPNSANSLLSSYYDRSSQILINVTTIITIAAYAFLFIILFMDLYSNKTTLKLIFDFVLTSLSIAIIILSAISCYEYISLIDEVKLGAYITDANIGPLPIVLISFSVFNIIATILEKICSKKLKTA